MISTQSDFQIILKSNTRQNGLHNDTKPAVINILWFILHVRLSWNLRVFKIIFYKGGMCGIWTQAFSVKKKISLCHASCKASAFAAFATKVPGKVGHSAHISAIWFTAMSCMDELHIQHIWACYYLPMTYCLRSTVASSSTDTNFH